MSDKIIRVTEISDKTISIKYKQTQEIKISSAPKQTLLIK